jgi:hypothetical protein
MTPRANVDDLLLVLHIRHYLFLRLEVRIVAGCADRIATGILFVLLIMVAQLVLLGYLFMAPIANNLHAQLAVSIMRTMAFFAGRYLFCTSLPEHVVEILHVYEALFAMAALAVDGLVGIKMWKILKVRTVLIVAVETVQIPMDGALQYRFTGVNAFARLRFQVLVSMAFKTN